MKKIKDLDIIIPISLELDHPTRESITSEILEQYDKYGFTRFALACPSGGWRSCGYPPTEYFKNRAELFLLVKNDLTPYGIDCGWWITATLKSGLSSDFSPIVRSDGSPHPFSNCPLDPEFRSRFANNVALFAKIAKPCFIITEDDYSIHAASPDFGCFCPQHLKEFAKRMNRNYTREQLVEAFSSKTKEGYALLREWRTLMKDSLVGCAEAIRKAVDIDSPEIPIGYMQAGNADKDGDVTLAISRALAGNNHTPFSRIYGTFYGGVRAELIPGVLFHPLYSRQHIEGDFIFYHESDAFPHTRFFTSGKEMCAIMGAAYSMGFDGSTFQTQQLLDYPNEETAYGNAFKKERKRFNEVHRIAKQCELKGIELCYDPFWNTVDGVTCPPHWTQAVSLFGIPYTTKEANTAFIDKRQAMFWDDETIKKYLSKTIFMDGVTANILCERGYSEYLGVSVSNEDITYGNSLLYDLGAREIICDNFLEEGKGHNMPSAHMLAPSNGKMLKMSMVDSGCEVVSEMFSFKKEFLNTAMTRFKNKLGGTVIVMSITIAANYSQSLLNYRRQRLVQKLLTDSCDEFVYVKENSRVYTLMNEAIDAKKSGFFGMLTLINLSSDVLPLTHLHLPPAWRNKNEFLLLDCDGKWQELKYAVKEDGIVIEQPLDYLEPMFILCR